MWTVLPLRLLQSLQHSLLWTRTQLYGRGQLHPAMHSEFFCCAHAGNYSEAAFVALDKLIARAGQAGIKLLLTFGDNWMFADSKMNVSAERGHLCIFAGLRPASGVDCAALQQLHGGIVGTCFCFCGHPVWLHSTPPSGPLTAAQRLLLCAVSLFWAQHTYMHLTDACLHERSCSHAVMQPPIVHLSGHYLPLMHPPAAEVP